MVFTKADSEITFCDEPFAAARNLASLYFCQTSIKCQVNNHGYRIGNEGAIFMTYYAEQSCTAGRNAFFTGMHPLRTGMIPPQLAGQSVLSASRHASAVGVPA